MIMVDTDIRALISEGILYSGDDTLSSQDISRSVHAVSYDLHTRSFVNNETVNMNECLLEPGESVFVSSKEILRMPDTLIARIVIRNSRLRQGLSLEAPVYQPGHHTRIFFRLTNVSSKSILLNSDNGYAAVMFERLDHAPEQPYNGAFQGEMVYSDMASYSNKYKKELVAIDSKIDEVRHLEKNIYTNTITWMSIFIALFSLINVNVGSSLSGMADVRHLVLSNLATIGSIAFLVSLIQLCFPRQKTIAVWIGLLVISLAILVVSACIALH